MRCCDCGYQQLQPQTWETSCRRPVPQLCTTALLQQGQPHKVPDRSTRQPASQWASLKLTVLLEKSVCSAGAERCHWRQLKNGQFFKAGDKQLCFKLVWIFYFKPTIWKLMRFFFSKEKKDMELQSNV